MNWNVIKALVFVAIGVPVGVAGCRFGEADDSPGFSLLSIVLMIGGVVLAVRSARRPRSARG